MLSRGAAFEKQNMGEWEEPFSLSPGRSRTSGYGFHSPLQFLVMIRQHAPARLQAPENGNGSQLPQDVLARHGRWKAEGHQPSHQTPGVPQTQAWETRWVVATLARVSW